MPSPDPFRKIPSVGSFGPEDARDIGIECPVCGKDAGYPWRCAHCGRPDPQDASKGSGDLADARSKPHRFLARCLQASDSIARLRTWVRGIRSIERAELWLDAADDLHEPMTDAAWHLLVQRRLVLDEDPRSLDDPEALLELIEQEGQRADPRRHLIGWLNQRVRQARQAPDPAATPSETAVATDGGSDDPCRHDEAERSVHEVAGERALWCRQCEDFVERLED